ncbi:MAG: peptide/nickel transport system ATP-binding protein [Chitinophagales bacterium]|jgi:peptide/nickel transport system ATP-binding protein
MSLLQVENLSVSFASDHGELNVLDKVSFNLAAGTTLGIVGESGCGKSVTALSINGLLPKPAGSITGGEILFDDEDLVTISLAKRFALRGRRIAMIFQEPMTALNPVHRIGKQLAEVYQIHFPKMRSQAITTACVEVLTQVGIADPIQRLRDYPHQLSGGMRQRVVIAMALACKPDILIADEPTTALDVTIQAQILVLLKELQQQTGMAIIFITHDLGVIAQMCDQIVVMYAGRVVEHASNQQLFTTPRHPYTRGLLNSLPQNHNQPKTLLPTIEGNVPAIADFIDGCRFAPRCRYQQPKCIASKPIMETIDSNAKVACIRWQDLTSGDSND